MDSVGITNQEWSEDYKFQQQAPALLNEHAYPERQGLKPITLDIRLINLIFRSYLNPKIVQLKSI